MFFFQEAGTGTKPAYLSLNLVNTVMGGDSDGVKSHTKHVKKEEA